MKSVLIQTGTRRISVTKHARHVVLSQPKKSGATDRYRASAFQVNAVFKIFDGRTSKNVNKKQELVDRLLMATVDVDSGFRVGPQQREEIAEIVENLQSYCMRDPLASEYIFGRWTLRYASKPQTAGGPFKTPIGRTVFPGQQASQIIEEPNLCVNEIRYKTLGFLPGSVRQEGTIEPIDGRTFELTFTTNTGKRLGGPPKRVIETLYLDENIRIAQSIPQSEIQEAGFYVFTREGAVLEVAESQNVSSSVQDGRESVSAREMTKVARGTRKVENTRWREEGPSAAEKARIEREVLATRRREARDVYNDLASLAKDLAQEAQNTSKELSMKQRDLSKITRQAAGARRVVEQVEAEAESREAQLIEAQAIEISLEKQILEMQRRLNRVKQEVVSTRQSIGPKLK
eukprot:jgi/Picsp_1/6814/NSC_04153-R1_plastid-lipid-associated protein 8